MRDAYQLTDPLRNAFREQGFVRLPQVFSASEIAHWERIISAAVAATHDPDAEAPPNSDSDAYRNAFTQVMNLWRRDEAVKALVFNRRLAAIAAGLLGVGAVRLYHDQALFKEVGGGFTPWHCDQYYWPLDSDQTVTAWIPLQDTDTAMGALAFSAGSHRLDLGRDLPIGPDSERVIATQLQRAGLPTVQEEFCAGDVSFHAGWTFHRAGPNLGEHPRRAMTVIYMADGICLKAPENANQAADRDAWCPGAVVGAPVATPLNPVLYSGTAQGGEQ